MILLKRRLAETLWSECLAKKTLSEEWSDSQDDHGIAMAVSDLCSRRSDTPNSIAPATDRASVAHLPKRPAGWPQFTSATSTAGRKLNDACRQIDVATRWRRCVGPPSASALEESTSVCAADACDTRTTVARGRSRRGTCGCLRPAAGKAECVWQWASVCGQHRWVAARARGRCS
jgi:hypothetical protein